MDVDPAPCANTDLMIQTAPMEPFISFGKAKPFRILFNTPDEPGPWSYNEEEHAYLSAFKQFCFEKGVAIPETDAEILRWAYANKMDNERTYSAIQLKNELMVTRFPFLVRKRSFELLQRGFMYICGRDRMFRPIIVLRFQVLLSMNNESPLDPDDIISAALVNIYFMKKYMLQDKVLENIIQIMDKSGLTLFTMPFKLMKPVFSFIPNIIRGRARTVFGLNAPSTISIIWNTIKYFLDENTQQKVQFTS